MLKNLLITLLTSFSVAACTLISPTPVITNKNYQTLCSPLALQKNETFIIKLPSSRFSGYKWKVESDTTNILQLIKNNTQRDKSPENNLHREETIWEYKAINIGETTLSFIYQLDWENKIQDSQRVQCTVTVRNI